MVDVLKQTFYNECHEGWCVMTNNQTDSSAVSPIETSIENAKPKERDPKGAYYPPNKKRHDALENANRLKSQRSGVAINKLVPFSLREHQVYQGERLESLANDIEEYGLRHPIDIRPIDDEKFEIICGHNRTEAYKLLKRDHIPAHIYHGLPDDQAIAMFYGDNLNQQSFSDWNYAQKIEAVKYIDSQVKENSRQGKRNNEAASVHDGQKLDKDSNKDTTRDKMSRRFGVSPSTFGYYRSIIKLEDEIVQVIANLLDAKQISFGVAYILSKLKSPNTLKMVLGILESLSSKPNKDNWQSFFDRAKNSEESFAGDEIRKMLNA